MLFVILAHQQDAKSWEERAESCREDEGRRAFAHNKMLIAERRAEDAAQGFSGKVVEKKW